MRHRPLSNRTLVGLTFAAALALAAATTAAAQQVTFKMDEALLRSVKDSDNIQPTVRVNVTANGPLHPLGEDCEMHVAGTVQGMTLGVPPAVVVEFPNWCKFNPQGQLGQNFDTLRTVWDDFIEQNVLNRTCDVRGFLRIFCEHCQGGGSGGSNPDHAYELHPAMSMRCGGQNFNFGPMLRAFPGLRHISTGTAAQCIGGRRLRVRFRQGMYEFSESGGGTCGNFAIVRVRSINLNWSIELEGGHYTFARVTADGHQTAGIGLYTLSGTPLDSWLRQSIANNGAGASGKVIHGVFTYDWEAIVDTLSDGQGNLLRPAQWQVVEFPLALIAYGETQAPF